MDTRPPTQLVSAGASAREMTHAERIAELEMELHEQRSHFQACVNSLQEQVDQMDAQLRRVVGGYDEPQRSIGVPRGMTGNA